MEHSYLTKLLMMVPQSLFRIILPLLEPEIIFIVQEDLPYDADLETIRYHTRIAPGIEIPDARYKNWFPNFTLSDLISDNTATGLVVVGDPVDGLDNDAFANVHLNLYKDDKCIATGESSEVLGNPLNAIHWLIKNYTRTVNNLKRRYHFIWNFYISTKIRIWHVPC